MIKELFVVPNVHQSYLRSDETLTRRPLVPLKHRDPDAPITRSDIGRMILTNRNTGQVFYVPDRITKEEVLTTTIVAGHDLLAVLRPLQCTNHFGVTTNILEN